MKTLPCQQVEVTVLQQLSLFDELEKAMPPCRLYPPEDWWWVFLNAEERREYLVAWKLVDPNRKSDKTTFIYKPIDVPVTLQCKVVGCEQTRRDEKPFIAVIELPGGHRTTIHAAYLRQMQDKNFDPCRAMLAGESE